MKIISSKNIRRRLVRVSLLVGVFTFVLASIPSAAPHLIPSALAQQQESEMEICDSRNPASWREAQTVEGVDIEADPSCSPDMPELVAASTKGTNNVDTKTLNATGLSPDAVVKENDKDGDGDPDVIHIRLEIIGLNEGKNPVVEYEIAPGIKPAFWTFAPKSTGMATEGMTAAHLMRMPSPSIRVEEGDEVKITVENTHYLPHTIHFHGTDHPYIDKEGEGNDGVPITSEKPILPGESRTYDFSPRTTGSMFYHCHVQPDAHVLMGLQGMFVIEENRPNNRLQTLNVGGGKVRHRSQSSKVNYDGEFDLQYQGVDKELHKIPQKTDDPKRVAKLTNRVYDVTERTPDYFLLNGKSFPYTLRESQIIVEPNRNYRLRVLNGGSETISIHTHGHKFQVEALDGVELQRTAKYRRDVMGLTAAQRVDLSLSTVDNGLHSYGEGVWLFHDHREKGVTTDGMSPGGNISMITYSSFLKENGIPETQGVDLSRFFDPEFYERKIPIWEQYAEPELLGEPITSQGLWIKVLIALALGFLIGLLVMWVLKRKKKSSKMLAIAILSLLVPAAMLMGIPDVYAQTDSLEGIHIMADGSVMLGNGETVEDAIVTEDGMIKMPDGQVVEPVMDMREGGSMNEMEGMGSGSMEKSSTESIGPEGLKGIHIMPNGKVMTGTGEWVDDATLTDDGKIRLGSGEVVDPLMDMRSGGGMQRAENSVVINENTDTLPLGCSEISEEKSITIEAGKEHAKKFTDLMFTYDQHELSVKPCTKLTVTFKNKDHVRHQFMVHDLPRDTYPMGMFNIEVTGPGEATGTFITPPDQKTLLFHCGVPQHEEKGMMGQVKVDGGKEDIENIPGITRNHEGAGPGTTPVLAFGLLGLVVGGAVAYRG